MAVITEIVYHSAGVNNNYVVPVGKKIYGFVGIAATDIDLTVDGVTVQLLSNTGVRMLLLPVPLELKASAYLTFKGNSNVSVGIIRDE